MAVLARGGFCITAFASLVFTASFLVTKINSPGMSIAVGLGVMPILLAIFGASKVTAKGISRDGKGAGWAAVVISLLATAYIRLGFPSWLIVAQIWIVLQLPMLIGIVAVPTSET